ncbi:uncharacterized protein LOC125658930 isoform X1 [Ostrea edulis]|uniref:uncharacterized protein LOC125658930 isoform X1 n=1 Tax=Ostrea edulis TaxID=37623 RepID=UPI002095A715|nr:uncharacterized protein LOC125658930 isoform X1 [Ostrea edulis]XP_056005656.1 uncharacterized protein LOC125658930 isoform X1 [Ostrea edulis]
MKNNMANISKSDLLKAIKEIVKGNDLSSLSAKKVRRALEERFNVDFTNRKKEVDAATMEIVKQMTEAGSGAEDSDDNVEEAKSNGTNESSDNDLSDDEPPTKKVKPEKKDAGEEDEDIARRLQEEENTSRRPSRAVAKKPKKPRKRKEKDPDDKKQKKSVYSKPCSLSPVLAEVMGTDKMARSEVVKKMWTIIKERNLQDPKNKQFLLCDDQLFNVFKKKRVKTFGMMKILRNHIYDLQD